MTFSNVTRRGMIAGIVAGVGAAKAFAECKADKSRTVLENTTSGHAVVIDEPDWLTDVLLKAV